MMGQFWPPGMDPLAEDCKWYQAACINVVVRAAHACTRTAIGNPNKGGDRTKRAWPALPFLIPWRVFLGAWVKNPYPRVLAV